MSGTGPGSWCITGCEEDRQDPRRRRLARAWPTSHYGPAEKMRQPKIGYDYVHSLVDDHSRLAYSEIWTDETGTTCAGFLLRAAAYFAAHQIPRIERLITDNALAYRHSTAVKQAVAQLGAKIEFIEAALPLAKRQGRAVQPHPADRMGLPAGFLSNPDRAAALAPGWSSRTLDADTPHLAASRQRTVLNWLWTAGVAGFYGGSTQVRLGAGPRSSTRSISPLCEPH